MEEDIFQLIAADYTFKKIFATSPNQQYIIRFLNLIVGKRVGKIKQIEYLSTEHYGIELYQKKVVFDIMCRDEKQNNFIIEMQHTRHSKFVDRSITYLGRAISSNTKKGSRSYDLVPIYVVCLLDFELPEFTEKGVCVQEVFLKNQENEILTDKVGLFYVFLRNFACKQEGVPDELRLWMKLITQSNLMRESDYAQMDNFFKGLLNECRISKLNDMEKEEYRKSVLEYEDVQEAIANTKEWATKEGYEEGYEKGIEKGIEKGRRSLLLTAKNFLAMGIPLQDVLKATGLSEAEVRGER